jgi:hypothetical protein
MKAKLKKERDGDYTLTLNNPKEYPHSLPLLSKQNCDEIFGVVDVEKLFNEVDETIDFHEFCFSSFKLGFNKAMELNKDKVFTLEQVIEAMTLYIRKEYAMSQVLSMISEIPLDSEIDVEIEMYRAIYHTDMPKEAEKRPAMRPKVDENGCLILKPIR